MSSYGSGAEQLLQNVEEPTQLTLPPRGFASPRSHKPGPSICFDLPPTGQEPQPTCNEFKEATQQRQDKAF